MITLNVYFVKHENNNGTACLIENLITDDVSLEIEGNLYLNEINSFINKAVNLLKTRYKTVSININWDSIEIEEVKDNE